MLRLYQKLYSKQLHYLPVGSILFASCISRQIEGQRETLQLKGIVSRDFGVPFLFIWIVMKFLIGPDQVYFSF
jgi:hypothetical protein